jgi:hypothetical protein
MKRLVAVSAALLLSGCALTHEQLAERAHHKTNSELCMGLIQYPQFTDIINAELEDRGRTCDMSLAAAQVQAQQASSANRQAALSRIADSLNANAAVLNQQAMQASAASQNAQSQSMRASQSGVTAFFTGNQRQVQTVTNQLGWNCEYRYMAQTFWRTFTGQCPTNLQIQ